MEKILIVKLGAKGDVLRTWSIIPALRKKYPNSHITWVTKESSFGLFEGNNTLDNVVTLPFNTDEKFDALYNFDIEPEATEIAKNTNAKKKYGFYSEGNYPAAFNPAGEYYLNTLFDDDLKKTNTKTYQQMMFDIAELHYNNEHYSITIPDKEKGYAREFIRENRISGKIIGIHMGSSPRWPSKAWSEECVEKFISLASSNGYKVILFGGPDERNKHPAMISRLKDVQIYQNSVDNTDMEFASLVNICDFMVCSDSFALHVALGLKKKTIGLFFVTSPNEIEGYGLLKKIVSPRLKDFFPEKSDQFDEDLVKSIKTEEVMSAIESS